MLRKVTVAALSALLATSFAMPAWAANEIGVTSAVLPNARGTPPDQDTRILQVGNDMFADERVQTVENGKVHLLFLDGSAMSIGPNSDIVLDEFVYNPDTKTGNLSFAATKGVFRFVGGRISKTSPVTIKTPNATIGIRGGVALIAIGAVIRATLVFGDELFILSGERVHRITTPGFQLQLEPDGSVGPAVATTGETLDSSLDMLEGTPEQTADTRDLIPGNAITGSQIGNFGSNLAPRVAGPADTGAAAPAELVAGGDTLADDTEVGDSTEVNLGQDNPDAGGGGGQVVGGLVGLYRHADVRTNGTDVDASLDELLNNGTIVLGQANAQTEDGFSVVSFPVSTTPAATGAPGAGSYLDYDNTAVTDSPFGAIVPGTSFVADTGEFAFVFADETNFAGHGVFAFVGAPTPASAIPTSGFSAYSVRRDLFLNGDIPFIPEVDGGNFGLESLDSGRAFINWAPNGSGERAFAQLTTFYSGLGGPQKSQTSVAPGRIVDDGTGKLHLFGKMRGSLRPSTTATDRTIYYASDISSLDAFGGSDFFGTTGPDFFVLSTQSVTVTDVVNPANSGIERSLNGAEAVLYDANLPTARLLGNGPAEDATRITGTMTWRLEYGGILSEFFGDSTNNFARIIPLPTNNPSMNVLTVNGGNGTVDAIIGTMSLDQPEVGGLMAGVFRFGGGSTENSAFVSNDEFGAVESSGATVNGNAVDVDMYFRSLDQRFVNLLSNVGLTPCDCEFLKIGLGGGIAHANGGTDYEFHQVPWVAGAPVTAADFPNSGTATYTGNTAAQVYNALGAGGAQIYTAFGTANASLTFSPGNVAITSMSLATDGATLNVAGGGATPGPFAFGGNGTRGAETLTAVGNARLAGTSGVLQNLYGSFAATNSAGTYRQSGVFAAD